MEKKTSISEEVAIKELLEFYNHFSLTPVSEDQANEDLNIVKIALMEGLLVFNDDKVPTFTLKNPLKNAEDVVTMTEITFTTRIFPKDHVRLSKGLNLQKDTMEYALRCTAYLAGLSTKAYLDKFSKFDYTVLQQLSTVFA